MLSVMARQPTTSVRVSVDRARARKVEGKSITLVRKQAYDSGFVIVNIVRAPSLVRRSAAERNL